MAHMGVKRKSAAHPSDMGTRRQTVPCCRSREHNLKPFLGKVPVVGQHVGEPFVTHDQHGATIGEAIMLIRTAAVEGEGLEKTGAALGNDCEAWSVEQGLNVASHT